MSDIAAFLEARYAEDERIALAALDNRADGTPEHWRRECTYDDEAIDVGLAIAGNDEILQHGEHYRVGLRSAEEYPGSSGTRPYPHLVITPEYVRPPVARHIARHDPARVLAQVAAGRARLAAYSAQDGYDLPEGVQDGRDPDERAADEAMRSALEDIIRIDAAVYADHPDYKEAWKP